MSKPGDSKRRMMAKKVHRRLLQNDAYAFGVLPIVKGAIKRRTTSLVGGAKTCSDIVGLASQEGWAHEVVTEPTLQRCDASKCLSEDMLEMLRHGPKYIRQLVHARINSKVETGETYFSQLHAMVRFPMSATFWVEVPKATILAPTGLAYDSEGTLFEESVLYDQIEMSLERQPDHSIKRTIEGRCLSLMSHWIAGGNYAHWLMDGLVRVALWGKTDVKVLIEGGASKFLKTSLLTLGFSEDQIVELEPGAYQIEQLIVVRAQDRSGVPHAKHIRNLGAMFRSAVGLSGDEPKKRLYVSRAKSNRPIVNEETVLPHLERHGFEIVYAEALTFAEQVRLFGTAEAIAGPHGAGMYNETYASPGCKVIEIINPLFFDHSSRRIASAIGADYWHILGENVDDQWRTKVDAEKFAKVLEYALLPADDPGAKRFDSNY